MTSEPAELMVPSVRSIRMLRVVGVLVLLGALGLLAEVGDLSVRGHGPVLVLWSLFLMSVGLGAVAVGFITIRPATGRFTERIRHQTLPYKMAGCVAGLAFIAGVAVSVAGTARLQ